MKIIEKIEIKYFRSFADKKVEILELRDVNIFSGSNDSGKSNVLRALNLFFNDEVSHGVKFNLEKDFPKITEKNFDATFKKAKRERKSDKFVSIKIHFLNPDKIRNLPEKFWVSKKYTNTNFLFGEKDYEKDIKNKANQVSHFLNSIHFQYVPAIKDKDFYNFLIDEYQKSLNPETKKLVQSLDEKIKDESKILFDEFQKNTPEIKQANFQIPKFSIDFAKTLKVQTENEIDLESRGDGIQAKFLPPLLDEISKNKKIVIWGFEEPENSLEYKNARGLADMFLNNYSDKKQIFITTHSKEFLRLRDKDKVSIYRVLKNTKDSSSKIILHEDFETDDARKEYAKQQLSLFPEAISKENKQTILDQIFSDLGMIDESRLIFDLEKQLKSDPAEIRSKIKQIINESEKNNQLAEGLAIEISSFKKHILFVEGAHDISYLNKAAEFLDKKKLLGRIEIKEGNGKDGLKNIWSGFLKHQHVRDAIGKKKVIILYDCDVNTINSFTDNIFRREIPKVKGNPIQKGIENLFSKDTLKKVIAANKSFIDIDPKRRPIINGRIIEIQESWNINPDQKANACKWICENGNNDDFTSFTSIFQIIEEVLRNEK